MEFENSSNIEESVVEAGTGDNAEILADGLRAKLSSTDGATGSSERIKRRAKRISRQGSKESVTLSGTGLTQAPRTWKNSRRPRNGHGRGLPKKGVVYLFVYVYIGLDQ